LGGKIDLVRTFMVSIDGSTLFLKVVFPLSFVLIFGALCWWCFEDDFLGFWWVSRMRFLCLFGW
jgi:hypothetical protein